MKDRDNLTADEEGLRKLTEINEQLFGPGNYKKKSAGVNPYYRKSISGLKKNSRYRHRG